MTATFAPAISEHYWADFEAPPGFRAEIIRGELVLTPSPTVNHGSIQTRLLLALQPFLPAGYESLIGVEWKLARGGMVAAAPQPDLMVVPRGLDAVVEAPLLVIEVLSPSDHHQLERSNMTRIQGKRADYADNGLEHYLEVAVVTPKSGPKRIMLRTYELRNGRLVTSAEVTNESDCRLAVKEPFPFELDPNQLT